LSAFDFVVGRGKILWSCGVEEALMSEAEGARRVAEGNKRIRDLNRNTEAINVSIGRVNAAIGALNEHAAACARSALGADNRRTVAELNRVLALNNRAVAHSNRHIDEINEQIMAGNLDHPGRRLVYAVKIERWGKLVRGKWRVDDDDLHIRVAAIIRDFPFAGREADQPRT
jgi:hypothetical protein